MYIIDASVVEMGYEGQIETVVYGLCHVLCTFIYLAVVFAPSKQSLARGCPLRGARDRPRERARTCVVSSCQERVQEGGGKIIPGRPEEAPPQDCC